MPKVSVIIPNYNHMRFLEQRIRTVLNQTYQDFEIIYLDDASTDNSNEVFAKFADNPQIRAIYNQTNSGSPFKQWNKGVRHANGEYIWIAESDDYADKRLLAELVDRLDNNPMVGIAYCQSWVVDEYGNTKCNCKEWLDSSERERWEKDFINIGKKECEQLIIKNTIPNASAVLIRRSIYEEVGYADESMILSGDWLLWAKMLLISDIAFMVEPLNYFRAHSGTVSHKNYRNGVYVEETYRVLQYIINNIEMSKKVVEQACERIGERWVSTIFSEDCEITWERNCRIYKIGSNVDSTLKLRLLKKIFIRWLRLFTPVFIMFRYIKRNIAIIK